MTSEIKKNTEVQSWWNIHPFAFGVNNTDRDQVGTIAIDRMDNAYFDEIERRFRKHHRHAAQDDGAPLFSKVVDLDRLRGKKVLDVAVGSGFSMVAFIRAGADVTGIDLTAFAVQHTKRNLQVRGLKGEVLQMDAQSMTFPDNTFDFVNAWGCIMHMPDPEKAIQEMYRVLKPGGEMLAYMYNKASWSYWFNYIFVRGICMGKLVRYGFDTTRLTSRYTDGYSIGGNPLTKFFYPREVDGILAKAGFREHSVKPWVLPHEPDNWPVRSVPVFKYLPRIVKRYISRFSYGLIIHAEK